MNVIGLDPSLTATGWATAATTGTITEGAGDDRLKLLYNAVTLLSATSDVAVVEDLPANAKSAGLTGRAQGVVRLALMRNMVPYVTVPAATVKKVITGKGNASKSDIRMAIYRRAGLDLADDNQADAWVLRQIGLILFDQPDAVSLPASHTADLAKKVTIHGDLEVPAA
jgi:Holliday junction resolvasome RuvABC endonuclease subunit